MLTCRRLSGLFLGVFLAVSQAPGTARATLIGDMIDVEIIIPNLSYLASGTTVVAADDTDAFTLTSGPALSFLVDPFASGVVITLLGQTAISLTTGNPRIEITDLDWTDVFGVITAISIPLTLNNQVITSSFTDDSVTLRLSGSNWAAGESLTLNITASHTEVPEPSTLALFVLGLAGLGYISWRRRVV